MFGGFYHYNIRLDKFIYKYFRIMQSQEHTSMFLEGSAHNLSHILHILQKLSRLDNFKYKVSIKFPLIGISEYKYYSDFLLMYRLHKVIDMVGIIAYINYRNIQDYNHLR